MARVHVAGWASVVVIAALVAGCQASSTAPPPSLSPSSPAVSVLSPSPTSSQAIATSVKGVDVSRYQKSVDWTGLWASGHRFVFVKATEGTSHRSPTYAQQSSAAVKAGFLVGGYHYARPAASTGAVQARFFARNGGHWTASGARLPGVLDLEAATKGDPCHGLTPNQMVAWVQSFSDTYRAETGRRPVIYVKQRMWDQCTARSTAFGDHPLWLYDHDGAEGPLPAGWKRATLWQWGIRDNLDRNVFHGSEDDLRRWARTAD